MHFILYSVKDVLLSWGEKHIPPGIYVLCMARP